jgi:hypothetical protein
MMIACSCQTTLTSQPALGIKHITKAAQIATVSP